MSSNHSLQENWFTLNDRVEYYLNQQEVIELDLEKLYELKQRNFWTNKEVKYLAFSDFKNSFTTWYCRYIMPLKYFREIRTLPLIGNYRDLHSLFDFFKPFYNQSLPEESYKYPLYYGEHGDTLNLPIIRKTRLIGDSNTIVYDFRSLRFNTPCLEVPKLDIPWSKKINDVVWRGATTGKGVRERFVEKYHMNFNIAFSSVKQKPEYGHLLKDKLSIQKQLQNKYIISLQGNDVASNLRWILSSNSVPIMPKPKWVSWIMEDHLKPFEHYLELNEDLSNLDELLSWAQENDEKCNVIAQNGKKYISQFIHNDFDLKVKRQVLVEYARRTRIIKN